jgi:signal peptidase I
MVFVAISILAFVAALSIGPRFLPYQTSVVLSGSMEPAIPTFSLLVLQPVSSEELQVGDVITVLRSEGTEQTLITHRIVAKEEGAEGTVFVTKGDANEAPDSWRVDASGAGWRATYVMPYAGVLVVFLQQPVLRMLLIGLPILALTRQLLIEIWRPHRNRTEVGRHA